MSCSCGILDIAAYSTLFCFIYWLSQKLYDRWTLLPPGPFRFPLIGSLVQVAMISKEYPFIALTELSKVYGDVFFVKLGVVNAVAVNGYKAVKEITKSDEWMGRMDEYWQLDRTYNKPIGLIHSSVENWKETRRFTVRCLKDFGFGVKSTMESLLKEDFQEFCERFAAQSKKNNGKIHMVNVFNASVLNAAWSMVAGYRFPHDEPKLLQLAKFIDDFMKSGSIGAGLIGAYPFLAKITPKLVGFDKQHAVNIGIQKFLQGFVDEYKKLGTYKTDPNNFIEIFLKKIDECKNDPETKFTEECLVAVLYDYFTGGSETSANALNFGVLFMILHPEIQDKVRKEIDTVVGREKLPGLEDKERLPYTEATILEVLRMCNVVSVIPRKVNGVARYGKYIIPEGTNVIVNFYSVNFDHTIWKEPFKFDPERFLDREGKITNADKLLVFSAGKRNCAGEQLARVTMFIFFAGLLQRFIFKTDESEPTPTTDVTPGFSNSPKPYNVIVQIRDEM